MGGWEGKCVCVYAGEEASAWPAICCDSCVWGSMPYMFFLFVLHVPVCGGWGEMGALCPWGRLPAKIISAYVVLCSWVSACVTA